MENDFKFDLKKNVIYPCVAKLFTNVYGAITSKPKKEEIQAYFNVSELINYKKSYDILLGLVTSWTRDYLNKNNKISSIAGRKSQKDNIYQLAGDVANTLGLQSIVVEKENEKYFINTNFKKGIHVLYFGDILTIAEEKIKGMDCLNEAEAIVDANLNILDTLEGGVENIKKQFDNTEIYSLTNIREVENEMLAIGDLSTFTKIMLIEKRKKLKEQ